MNRSIISVVALLACAPTACEGRRRAESRNSASGEERRSGPAVAILDLSDGAPEEPPAGFLGFSSKGTSFEELVNQVELLQREEGRPSGVLVRLGTTRLGLVRATEIGAMLER